MTTTSSSPRSIFTVTQEEFVVFHTIDRTLFTRMVFTLGRDAEESIRVMGLWLWLEQNGEEFNLVYRMLSLPDTLIDALSEEAVMALACIENDKFPFETEGPAAVDIPLIQHVSKTPVSLRFFHENRLRILRGVTKICNDICHRAFQDIIQNLESQRLLSRASMAIREANFPPAHGGYGGFFGSPPANQFVPAMFPNSPPFGYLSLMGESSQPQVVSAPTIPIIRPHGTDQRQIPTFDMSDALNRLQLSPVNEEDESAVPPDERTIFLTFSKGYPISEDEVKEYFARRYGDFIQSIHMQEVPPPEQPLYARLVVRNEATMDVVLEGRSKAKFSINGKHVWARKYVRKTTSTRSPLRASPPVTRPPSPPLEVGGFIIPPPAAP